MIVMGCARDIGSDEIIRILKSPEAVKVYEEHEVISAYLYGSAAHGRMHAHSDVDVAVVFDHSVPRDQRFRRRLRLIGQVKDLLGIDEADVVPLNDAPLLLAFHVLRDPVLLFSADDYARSEFELRTLGLYYDFAPILGSYVSAMRERVKERGLS